MKIVINASPRKTSNRVSRFDAVAVAKLRPAPKVFSGVAGIDFSCFSVFQTQLRPKGFPFGRNESPDG
jgi:hypothetical protein